MKKIKEFYVSGKTVYFKDKDENIVGSEPLDSFKDNDEIMGWIKAINKNLK